MAPLRRSDSMFSFHYSVPIESMGITRITYRSPSAPYRVRGVQPTVTRMFKERSVSSNRALKKEILKNASTSAMKPRKHLKTIDPSGSHLSSRERSGTPVLDAPAQSSPLSSPTSSPPDTPRLNRTGTSASSSNEVPRDNTSLTRSSLRISSRESHKRSQSQSQSQQRHPHPSAFQRRPPGPPGPGIPLWTCYGFKNGEPVYMRRKRISSTTDSDCLTAYWESFSLEAIHVPPDLSGKEDLQEGDLYCNSVHDTDITQTWIWTKEGNLPAFWKVIEEGDTREDGRRLSITPKYKYPSWVKAEWCVKQMAKHSRSGSRT